MVAAALVSDWKKKSSFTFRRTNLLCKTRTGFGFQTTQQVVSVTRGAGGEEGPFYHPVASIGLSLACCV